MVRVTCFLWFGITLLYWRLKSNAYTIQFNVRQTNTTIDISGENTKEMLFSYKNALKTTES